MFVIPFLPGSSPEKPAEEKPLVPWLVFCAMLLVDADAKKPAEDAS